MIIKNLLFGTAGIPLSTMPRGTVNGIKKVKSLNLNALELEFVRKIYIKKEDAPSIKEESIKEGVVLTAHCPYFINLNSEDKKKYYASIGYIKNSAIIASLCGGYSVCFHAGYYQKQDAKKVYNKIKEAIKIIVKDVKEHDKNIWIRPEISGKLSQFGSLNELIKISKEIEQVLPCVDFSHLYARTVGKNNTKEEFENILKDLEKSLGRASLNNMHVHLSGIEFTDKGEKNHLNLDDSRLDYKDLLRTLKEFKCKGVVICESPNIEKDAILLKETFSKMK